MDFFTERDNKMRICLERTLLDMPPFCRLFFLGKEQTIAMRTMYERGFILRYFFNYLSEYIEDFKHIKPTSFSLYDLEQVSTYHIQRYLEHLSKNNNSKGTIGCQVYALNTFFRYFKKNHEINQNPMEDIDAPKRDEKPVIRLDEVEMEKVLNAVDNGFRIKNGKRRLGKNHLMRDKTIIVFFLSTGIRISELVGLDYGDIDLDNASFRVRRKGGKREICFMTEELVTQLKDYLKVFPKTFPNEPMFMSIYKKRAGTKSIQDLVKHYCKIAGIKKRITPHKLRSTFGVNMYEKTRDIYLVADLLGHADVKTTTKSYTTIKEDLKREALKGYNLRTSNTN
jgi:site-specific recombinase XerD